jgi:hypothetical protein
MEAGRSLPFFDESHMMQMSRHSAQSVSQEPVSRKRVSPPWPGALCLIGLLALASPAHAIQLVTEQEAALPPDHLPPLDLRGSPTRRPSAVIVSPPPNAGVVQSPLHLKIKLEAHGGAKIDPDSIVLTYKKTPKIDLTQRIKPFITPEGIEVAGAEVPAGVHEFRIELKDREGRLGGAEFSFQVGR